MKRILMAIVAIATIATVTTSCSKSNESLIIGKWQLTSIGINGEPNVLLDAIVVSSNAYFDFKKNGDLHITALIPPILTAESMPLDATITYRVMDNKLLFASSDTDLSELPIDVNLDEAMTIVKLNRKQLTLLTITQESSEDGNAVTLNFKKL
jgi:hypothetical protein